jgi:hypothetical protein
MKNQDKNTIIISTMQEQFIYFFIVPEQALFEPIRTAILKGNNWWNVLPASRIIIPKCHPF